MEKLLLILTNKPKAEFINQIICNFTLISKETYGVSILKKLIISHRQADINFKFSFINSIKNDLVAICCDSFGNYAILCLLDEWGINVCSELVIIVKKNSYLLNTNRFGSRIVTKIVDLINNKVNKYIYYLLIHNNIIFI